MSDTERGQAEGPPGRWREYEVVILNDSTNFYRDHGMNLAKVIEAEQANLLRMYGDLVASDPEKAADLLKDEPDRVIWADDRAVAVLRPQHNGTFDVLLPETPACDCDQEAGWGL